MRITYTYSVLEVSAAAWDEIAEALRAAGWDQAFRDDLEDPAFHGADGIRPQLIDMRGVALRRKRGDEAG